MLISMPTGTSTIFGVFQAILALSFFNFFNRTDSALADKLMRNEKFASEIFFKLVLITSAYAAPRKDFTSLCGMTSNRRRIKRFRVALLLRRCSLPFELIKRIPCEMTPVP
jgi:hypothetical protein